MSARLRGVGYNKMTREGHGREDGFALPPARRRPYRAPRGRRV